MAAAAIHSMQESRRHWEISSGTACRRRLVGSVVRYQNHRRTLHSRQSSTFRNWVTPDGAPGPTGAGGFKAEPGRYHLYVSLACPWAHRTLIFRKLKGLEHMISLSVVHWLMGENGWTFAEAPGVVPDPIHGRGLPLPSLHTSAARITRDVSPCRCSGTSASNTIVNNECSEIIRMLNSAFDACGPHQATSIRRSGVRRSTP